MNTLTYTEVGATLHGPLPRGYHHLRHRTPVGRGREDFEAAGAAVTGWRVHRASGARIDATTARAEGGTRVAVSLGIGPLRVTAPCEVVRAVYGSARTGFAYGTRPGHPERGEESFVVDLADDGTVWFTVTAFSRPARWYTRVAGPLVPPVQRWYARRLGRTLRRIVATRRPGR
ncbi:DUF1990 family protein [Streptomyces fulvorobeus]|uniref:DUF1990 domain-containing protein n=1 Tax=Streptomyces fulvorobeus TaxID=284028 RepID=A0A7J0CFH6_9ACTN|nr:DUF1990 domain-containing protein [Streptomyces fulvorobeus]NYE44152.1 uncharacterized protein (UPF0548 family) [Streptomyces fulvorobeus]GFN00664.1 DUF1990 domain-containing protein [Streptomyces fulvorobeus]